MGWVLMIFTLITLVSGVFFYRICLWIVRGRKARIIFTIVYVLVVALFMIGRSVSRANPEFFINDFLVICGAFSLIILFYGFLGSLAAEAVRLFIKLSFRIKGLSYNDIKVKRILAFMVFGAVAVTVFSGYLHSRTKAVKSIYLISDVIKKETSIVFVSDVHFGRIIGKNEARKLVESINELNPDIIIFGGDLFDENLFSVKRDNIKDYLKKLHAPLGIFAVTGNHEYIGGVEGAVKYMEESGMTVLRNRVVKAGPLIIAGREDLSSVRMTDFERISLHDIIGTQKITGPLIVVDHEPRDIRESVKNKAFLHLSGHTHNGQFWPLKLILPFIYEVTYGHAVIENTNIYVTSGWGSWGPPVRVGTTPEVVKFIISPLK